MDSLLRSYENSMRGAMQFTGEIYGYWGAMMQKNPFVQQWAQPFKQFGNYLKEKGRPISSRPWTTPNQVIHIQKKEVLRLFTSGKRGNPLLFVPPEAGHNSKIVDFAPGQSLVQFAMNHYDGDVYVVEKLPAGPEHVDYSLDDCVRSLDLCIQHIGQPVNLVGLCQGGWQSAMYTALHPQRVKALVLAGAPIDFHAGEGLISHIAQTMPLAFFETLVSMSGGIMPGALIVSGFKLMNAFDRFIGDDMELFQNIEDTQHIERSRRFSEWYDYTQPLGGRMYLDVVAELFQENKLIEGRLEVLGRRVDLGFIYHPIYLVGGTRDDITPPAQLLAIREHVSSTFIQEELVDAGHIGVFMQKKVLNSAWKDIFDRLSRFIPDYSVELNSLESAARCMYN